ncbi:MAG: hypothetical protein ISR51_07300 [Rhodospirillales bacterium]|nr:hypothetical protein [Rhodospirillales bacterium]
MEQLNEIILSFEALAEGDDGTAVPFSLRVHQPEYDEDRGFYCVVECPFLRERHFKLFGVDEEQACELSIKFIRQSISDQRAHLVDEQGREVSVPYIPPETISSKNSPETNDP